jgi:hypothetical protein
VKLLAPFLTSFASFHVEGEQILEYLFVPEIRRPAVGRKDRSVEDRMRVLYLHGLGKVILLGFMANDFLFHDPALSIPGTGY